MTDLENAKTEIARAEVRLIEAQIARTQAQTNVLIAFRFVAWFGVGAIVGLFLRSITA